MKSFAEWRPVRIAMCAYIALLIAGCAQVFYGTTPFGKFVGRLDVEWIAPNLLSTGRTRRSHSHIPRPTAR